MSFLLQCLFYFINYVISFFCGDYIILEISDNVKLVLAGVSVLMMFLGFIVIIKSNAKIIKYLDIPLIFCHSALKIVCEIYISDYDVLHLLPSVFRLIPYAFYTARRIMWFVGVVKKERRPEKKNAIILVVYIVATLVLSSLIFFDFNLEKQKPTQEEVELLNECYEYSEKFLVTVPSDKTELEKIADITEDITDETNVFIRAYDKSAFCDNIEKNILNSTAKMKQFTRKKAYADVVALRLKVLIALKDYENYNNFFVENCGYLIYKDFFYYFNLWKKSDYPLSKEDFNAIISGYKSAYELCDNDRDRLLILYDIISFYNEFEPDNEELEKYTKLRSEIYNSNRYEDLLEDAESKIGYVSEKLIVN